MSELDFDPQRLTCEGSRLQAIIKWLSGAVWSPERFAAMSSENYLRNGEAAVCELEELIAAGAPRVWDELAAASEAAPALADWLGMSAPLALPSPHAAVVFDGLSLREMPMLLGHAAASGFRVKTARVIATSLPTETRSYVEQRVLGKPLSPSDLPGRREFAEKNAQAFYFGQPNSRENFPAGRSLLVWSHYPDGLFFDDNARSEKLFEAFASYIETIWKCTVQAIPPSMPIVVTSDHGYVFFGAGGEAGALQSDAGLLVEQSRWREFPPEIPFPAWHPDLQLVPSRRLALLRGRIRTRKPGPSSNRLYQHGGFSLMEVLVPWIDCNATDTMKIKIGTQLEEEVFQDLKVTAAREKRAISDLIQHAVTDYLQRKRQKSPHRSGLLRFLESPAFKITDEQFRETMEADFYDQ